MADFTFQNKNVVILIKDAILGGAERQALGFAKYVKENFNCSVSIVLIYSSEQTVEFQNFLKEIGIDSIYYFGPPSLSVKKEFSIRNIKKSLRALKYLVGITLKIRNLNPDILVPFMNGPSKIASLIYSFTGAKTTFWQQLGLEVYFYDWLEQIAVKRSQIIIANAENGLDVFKDFYNIPKKKLYVLPQFSAIEKRHLNKEELKNELEIAKDIIVIGMVAHYREEKYQELLVEAFSEICNNYNIHLVLLGNKENNKNTFAKFNSLKNLVSHLQIQEKVTIVSGISVHKVLNVLDIGVLVSEVEGTPNVIMEYMLYGLPVIASNHKGCCALLGDSTYLIPNEKRLLINKLEELIVNKSLRKIEGHKNAEKIKENSPENYFIALQRILSNHT